jgi:hypothetical protein
MRCRMSAPMLRPAEVEREQAHRLVEEYGLRDARGPLRVGVVQQWLVVAALGFPLLDRLRGDTLHAQMHARHVVGRVDHEEQEEGDQVDADQNRYRVQRAAYDVGEHQLAPTCTRWFSWRR